MTGRSVPLSSLGNRRSVATFALRVESFHRAAIQFGVQTAKGLSFTIVLLYSANVMKMIKAQIIVLGVTVALLSGCDGSVGNEVGKEVSKELSKEVVPNVGNLVGEINNEVVKEIGKKYPLPDQVVINNAHNDNVNFTTPWTLDKVVEFYRQAYAKQGIAEVSEAASVGSDSAKLAFRAGDKTIDIEIEKRDNGTKVHLEKR